MLVLAEGSLLSGVWGLLRLVALELERGAPPARGGRAACSECPRPARSSRGGALLCRFCAVERRCRKKRAALTAKVAAAAAAAAAKSLEPRARWDPEGAWRRRARALGGSA